MLQDLTMELLECTYGGGFRRSDPARAAIILSEHPEILQTDPYVDLCAGIVSSNVLAEPNQPGGPLKMPPLVAVTFSSLIKLPEYAEALRSAAQRLLEGGANPDQNWIDDVFPDWPLSALFGAAGKNHDPALTRILLAAGANPNDDQSLYHSLGCGDLTCTRLLLDAGAVVTGSNAMLHVLDYDDLPALELLLANGGDPNEGGRVLSWAIRRRRSLEHVRTLLAAGADPAGLYEQALCYGLPEVARLLPPIAMSVEAEFVAACAMADRAKATMLLNANPGLIGRLSPEQLRMLPELAFTACDDAVRCMVDLGWPIAVPGGDWQASALNAAVFLGNPSLTRFLLEHGASWTEEHGYNDNVGGTLEFASRYHPVPDGDWNACAEILEEFGMPPRKNAHA